MRAESGKNIGGVQGVNLHENSGLRFRSKVTYLPNRFWKATVTPQADKVLGGPNAANLQTSGEVNHENLDFVDANLKYKPSENLEITLGREMISYGDEALVGKRNWVRGGQAFDLMKVQYQYKRGFTDILYSKISNSGTLTTAGDDADFWVLYNHFHWNRYLKNLDIYFMGLDDDRAGQPEVNNIGLQMNGNISGFFYMLQYNTQAGRDLGDDADSMRLDLGYKTQTFRAYLEYGTGGKDFRILFPSRHKFLGIASVLRKWDSRENGL